MKRLTWALAISLMLHVIVLFLVHLNNPHKPTRTHSSLTVNLIPFPASQPKNSNQEKNLPLPIAERKQIRNSEASPLPKLIEITNSGDTFETSRHLDMEQLRSQAREYANKELATVKSDVTMEGDYYGTYTGSDSGTFFVHLNSAGHASGSGQSNMHNINFIITGDVTKDGFVQMSGSGIAGDARFEGQLKISTGKISGSWLASGIGSGSFSGQHE